MFSLLNLARGALILCLFASIYPSVSMLRTLGYYPYVSIDVGSDLRLQILQDMHRSAESCEKSRGGVVNAMQAACPTCRIVESSCLTTLSAQQQKLLSNESLDHYSVQFPNGAASYSTPNVHDAEQVCKESERQSNQLLPGSARCFAPHISRSRVSRTSDLDRVHVFLGVVLISIVLLSPLHPLLDAVTLLAGLQFYGVIFAAQLGIDYAVATLWLVTIFILIGEASGLYVSWRGAPLGKVTQKTLFVWFVAVTLLAFFALVTRTSELYSHSLFLGWLIVTPLLLLLQRVGIYSVMRYVRRKGNNRKTLAIAGGGQSAAKLASEVMHSEWMGFDLVGIFKQEAELDGASAENMQPYLRGDLSELIEQARQGKIDYVCIALPPGSEDKITALVAALSDTTASVYIIPDLFVTSLMNARWTRIGGFQAVSVYESPFLGVTAVVKRAEDIVFASAILTIIAIPMMLIALGVRLTSPGSVIFKQRRYGLNGKIVEVLKFRSMTASDSGENAPQARRNDPRVTPFGAFLRRTSLDELPQFINVLKGEMSIVGPRPHPISLNEEYRKQIYGYMLRHKVKPGITGWAQINGFRGETDSVDKMENRVRCDLYYIQNWSLWLDIKIIVRTIFSGFTGKQAY